MAHARKGRLIKYRLPHGHAELAGVQSRTFDRCDADDNMITMCRNS